MRSQLRNEVEKHGSPGASEDLSENSAVSQNLNFSLATRPRHSLYLCDRRYIVNIGDPFRSNEFRIFRICFVEDVSKDLVRDILYRVVSLDK